MDVKVEKKVEVEVSQHDGLSTAAIIVIAIGAYLVVFVLLVLIRKVCLAKDQNFCPSWCSEVLLCTACTNTGCSLVTCASCVDNQCSCCTYPNKRCFMDAVCPSKQWCDQVSTLIDFYCGNELA